MIPSYFVNLLLSASLGIAQQGELKTFGDWIVGCDNGLNCHATSLNPEGEGDGDVFVTVKRGGARASEPVVTMFLSSDLQHRLAHVSAISIALDDKLFSTTVISRKPTAIAPLEGGVSFIINRENGLSGSANATIIKPMIGAKRVGVVGNDGIIVGGASLIGLSAALLYIDEQQHRIGTVTALVRKGPKSSDAIPAAPKIPLINIPPRTSKSPVRLSAAAEKQERLAFKCKTVDEFMKKYGIEYHRLDSRTTLALIPPLCDSGAYNTSIRIAVINNKGAITVPAIEMPIDAKAPNLLSNAWWDKEAGTLNSFWKARPLGDCGILQNYVWDGTALRLVKESGMVECRGSADYITTWQAQIASPVR